jgi:hypothetical protein
MATTARKKKEPKVSIKEGEKLKPLPVTEVDPKSKEFLDPSHLMQLEVISRDIDNSKLSMALEEQSLQNMLLSLEILQSKIEKQKLLVSSKNQRYEASKTKFQNFKKEIWPHYGLNENEGLGYDPVTGEIKRN